MRSLIGSDANGHEVEPFMMDEEEVEFPLEGKEEHSNLIAVDSKESRNFLGAEDVETGIGSIPMLKSLK